MKPKKKVLFSGTLGEAIKQGRITQKQADEMLADRTDEEQEAYEQGIQSERKRICEIIDWCIGYNQFNSIGEQSRMIEVKELLAKINSEKTAE